MNNLILCSKTHDKYENAIAASLKKNNINFKVLYFEDNKLGLDQLSIFLKKYSHFTIIPHKNIFKSDNIKYVLGYLSGTKKSTYIYNDAEKIDFSFLGKKYKIVTETDDLDVFFLKEKRLYFLKKRMLHARKELRKLDLCLSTSGMFDAVDKGLTEVLKLYIMAGFSADLKTSAGLTLLGSSCRKGHVEIVKLLLSSGANVNIVSDDRGNTPIMDAASEGYDKIIDILLDHGAGLDIMSKNGQTALILAIGANKTNTAVKLINAGADISIKDALGMDAKKYAELFKNKEILDMIV